MGGVVGEEGLGSKERRDWRGGGRLEYEERLWRRR